LRILLLTKLDRELLQSARVPWAHGQRHEQTERFYGLADTLGAVVCIIRRITGLHNVTKAVDEWSEEDLFRERAARPPSVA
jgi:hypothetical protein